MVLESWHSNALCDIVLLTTMLHKNFITFASIMRHRNAHIRNILHATIASVAALLIALGSIVQFHHHNHGDIFLSVSLSSDIRLGNFHGVDICTHTHDNGNDRGDDCAMHLDDSSLSRDNLWSDTFFVATNSLPCADIDCPILKSHIIVYSFQECAVPPAPPSQSPQLRAPPAL